MIRFWVPNNAKLLNQKNPSGKITINQEEDKDFTIFEIPQFILPGETLQTTFTYQTTINRGSLNWRPYFFQLSGTPGRDKTEFLKTISTPKNGKFTAETQNIGRPQPLVDSDFRAVVEFGPR